VINNLKGHEIVIGGIESNPFRLMKAAIVKEEKSTSSWLSAVDPN
jgi:hypothetical protein